MSSHPQLSILLANPRGFCAGVDRAISMVENALKKFGEPIYVRHQIVHNRHVVERLEGLGAIFVKELDEVPTGGRVIFSAHGVAKSVPAQAERLNLISFDATCPLVTKVHKKAEHLIDRGYHILLVGHAGHPEVVGTMGQVPQGHMTLVETAEDVAKLDGLPSDKQLAFITQTTLSVDDTAGIVDALNARFPDILAPKSEDICYATTNRQEAIKAMSKQAELVLVVGAANSSNSNRLVETALLYGAPSAHLVADVNDIDWHWLDGVTTLGLTAGASAPEHLVTEIIEHLRRRFDVSVSETSGPLEDVIFRLPRTLEDIPA